MPKREGSETNKRTSKEFCCVPFCMSARWKDRSLSFHRFPRKGEEEARRALWIKNLGITKEVTPTMPVCSKHFARDCYFLPGYSLITKRRLLKKTAVPTLNLPPLPIHDTSKAARCQEPSVGKLKRKMQQSARKKQTSSIATSCSLEGEMVDRSLVSTAGTSPLETEGALEYEVFPVCLTAPPHLMASGADLGTKMEMYDSPGYTSDGQLSSVLAEVASRGHAEEYKANQVIETQICIHFI